MEAHETRARALSGLKSKFHTARPWQKKVESNIDVSNNTFNVEMSKNTLTSRNVAESSEEEMEQVQ